MNDAAGFLGMIIFALMMAFAQITRERERDRILDLKQRRRVARQDEETK